MARSRRHHVVNIAVFWAPCALNVLSEGSGPQELTYPINYAHFGRVLPTVSALGASCAPRQARCLGQRSRRSGMRSHEGTLRTACRSISCWYYASVLEQRQHTVRKKGCRARSKRGGFPNVVRRVRTGGARYWGAAGVRAGGRYLGAEVPPQCMTALFHYERVAGHFTGN